MKGKGLFLTVIFLLILPTHAWVDTPVKEISVTKTIKPEIAFEDQATIFYNNLETNELSFEVFKFAYKGYIQLEKDKVLDNSKYLTVIDFSKSSKEQRLFIIDTENQQLIHKSLVAHGRNSGLEFAKKFSNKVNSHQSSLGFYKTAETYSGKHGFSLRLDGLEYSNNNARKRAIVIHAADYADKKFVERQGRLGRSYGCPSLPKEGYFTVIEKIKKGSCLFIYYPKKTYLAKSKLVNANVSISQDV